MILCFTFLKLGNDPISEAFSYIIKELREAKKMSKAALAEKAGLHQTYIGLLEAGKWSPSVDTVQALAKAFGIRPSALMVLAGKDSRPDRRSGSLGEVFEEAGEIAKVKEQGGK